MKDIYDTSLLPSIVNAGSSAVGSVVQGAGWLKQQFDQTTPETQRIIMGIVGLVGGAVGANLLAWGTGTQGTWAGTGMKWVMAIAAMAVLSSDANPFKAPINGAATPDNRDTPAVTEVHPRDPRNNTVDDGRMEMVLPRREPMPGPS